MADISKLKLPSGNVYDIKDAVARQAIAGGMSKIIAWNGSSAPTVADIPAGVIVTYNGTAYTGTLAAADANANGFYFVYSSTQVDGKDIYDEYTVVGSGNSRTWEKIGDTNLDLSNLGDLAYKDSASVTFSGQTTDKCLGSDATFTTTVTPTTTNIKATASGAAVGADGTASVVSGYASPSTDKCLGSDATFTTTVTPSTSKLVTTSVPNVTNAGTASTWSFAMGTGDDAETLIITGTNGSAPTLGAAITVASGSLAANGGGASVATGISSASTSASSKDEVTAITGLGAATTETVLTGVKVTSQPTVALSTGAAAGTGVISVATGITSASTATNSKDEVTAVTSIGTGIAS